MNQNKISGTTINNEHCKLCGQLKESEFADALQLDFMTKDDVPYVARLEKSIFAEPWSEELFINELSNGHVYLVVRDGQQIIGYGGMWQILDEGHITNIAVHPNYRRRNLADKILSRLEEIGRTGELISITLEVGSNNTAAQKLYEKHRFKPVGRRTKYYSGVEDAIIMTKMLT